MWWLSSGRAARADNSDVMHRSVASAHSVLWKFSHPLGMRAICVARPVKAEWEVVLEVDGEVVARRAPTRAAAVGWAESVGAALTAGEWKQLANTGRAGRVPHPALPGGPSRQEL